MRNLGLIVAFAACWWSKSLGLWFFWFVLLGLILASRNEAKARGTWAKSFAVLGLLGLVFAAAPEARSGLLNDPQMARGGKSADVVLMSFTGPFDLGFTGERLVTVKRKDGTSTEYRDPGWLWMSLNLVEPLALLAGAVLLVWLAFLPAGLRERIAGAGSSRLVTEPPPAQ